jgi:TPR repeat protein
LFSEEISQEMKKMDIKLSQSFWIFGLMLMLQSLSPVAFADVAGDMAKADEAVTREDATEAAKYYRQAAEQNYIPAQVSLGELLHASQDYEEASGWFIMAAFQGDAAAAFNLGQMYSAGEGVEKSPEKALYWIRFAANKNHLPAVELMVMAYKNGDFGLPIDLDQAKNWESKLPALRAAQKKIIDEKMAATRAAMKARFDADVKNAAENKAAEKKFVDEAAAKKVDNADDAVAK